MKIKRIPPKFIIGKLRTGSISIGILLLCFTGCVLNFKSEGKSKPMIHVDMHYRYPGRNEANTEARTYKKEIDSGHFAESVFFELDPGQQLLVLNKAWVLHFYEMPDTFYHKGNALSSQPQFLRIWADTLDRTVHWSGSLDSLQPSKYHLKELVEYVDSIVQSTDDVKALPKSKLAGD